MKKHESYEHYVFYEHNNEYVPLKIILEDVVGYYNEYENNDAKGMNFKLNGNLEDNFWDIFEDIKKKSNIDHISYVCESNTGEYLKMKMFDKTLLDKDNNHVIPSKKIKYLCSVALQIQSVWHSMKDKDKDVKYYSQVFLDQCGNELFLDTREIDHVSNVRINLNHVSNVRRRINLNLKLSLSLKSIIKILFLMSKK